MWGARTGRGRAEAAGVERLVDLDRVEDLALNTFCQHTHPWMHAAPAADLCLWRHRAGVRGRQALAELRGAEGPHRVERRLQPDLRGRRLVQSEVIRAI